MLNATRRPKPTGSTSADANTGSNLQRDAIELAEFKYAISLHADQFGDRPVAASRRVTPGHRTLVSATSAREISTSFMRFSPPLRQASYRLAVAHWSVCMRATSA